MEFVDGAELGDGTSEGVDAGRERASQRTGVLPGGEGIDGIEAVLEDGAGGIEQGIVERDGRREIDVEGADEMFAVDVEVRNRDSGVVGDFALEGEAGLLHTRSDEVGSEGGNIIGDALGESSGQLAGSGGGEQAAYQRIGIHGKNLIVVVVGVVEKELSVGDAVFGGDGGVVDLRNADVEDPVAGTDDERVGLADGVSETGARAEVMGIEGNFT